MEDDQGEKEEASQSIVVKVNAITLARTVTEVALQSIARGFQSSTAVSSWV